MRCVLIVTLPLVLISFIFSTPAGTQQKAKNTLPNPADFPQAGPTCKRRVKVSPIVTTPGVKWPMTFRCELTFHTCAGPETVTSDERKTGAGMCADYWKVHDELAKREICCDEGSPQASPSPQQTPSPEPKCQSVAPWFDRSSSCKEVKDTQLTISGGTATLYMCGYPVFYHTAGHDDLFNQAYRQAFADRLRARRLDKVCCDKFKEAVTTGKPCDPRADVDCDGQPNGSDTTEGGFLPDIDGSFTEASEHDDFPVGMTVDVIMPPDQCKDCKWELIKGVLKCNPDATKPHVYESTWKCPTTGAVVQVDKLSKPGAPCPG